MAKLASASPTRDLLMFGYSAKVSGGDSEESFPASRSLWTGIRFRLSDVGGAPPPSTSSLLIDRTQTLAVCISRRMLRHSDDCVVICLWQVRSSSHTQASGHRVPAWWVSEFAASNSRRCSLQCFRNNTASTLDVLWSLEVTACRILLPISRNGTHVSDAVHLIATLAMINLELAWPNTW
jgi:hypothetical protein